MNKNKTEITAQIAMDKRAQAGYTAVLSIIALLAVAAALAGGFYVWKQQNTQIDLLQQYVEKIETQLGIKDKAVQEFRNSLSKLAAESQGENVILNDHVRMLKDDMQRISQRVGRVEGDVSSQNWLLAEVEYLVKIANQRILIEQDVAGALTVLQKAEKLLGEMPEDDQGLMDVRVAIAKDIASMEMYSSVDVPGTYAELSALGEMIEKLPLIPLKEPASVAADKSDKPADKQPSTLAKINEAFAGYITIRRHDSAELKALLSPEQRLNLRDGLRLSLDQAQTALLRGDQRIYDDSLSKIRRRVLRFFVTDDFRTKSVIRRLESLSKVQVEFDLPDIAISQQALKRYISDRARRMQ